MNYAAGQVWRYHTRATEPESTFTVCKVEFHSGMGEVIHISVQGLRVKNPSRPDGYSDTIAHLPMSLGALDSSVLELVAEHAALPNYLDGYKTWQENKGGVFTIPVAKCVDLAEHALKQ